MFIEIWRGKIDKDSHLRFCLVENSLKKVSSNLGLFTIADINRDGMLDLIFPILKGDPSILIAYNQITVDDSNWEQDYCATHTNQQNQFGQVFLDFPIDFQSNNVLIDDLNHLQNQIVFVADQSNQKFYSSNLVAPIIRIGDFNIDGYPDITFVLENKDLSRKGYVFFNCNVAGGSEAVSASDQYQRTFNDNCGNVFSKLLINSNNIIYSSFFDFDENGQLDLITVSKQDSNIYSIQGLYNNYNFDTFFLKSVDYIKEDEYVTFALGTTYRFIVTILSGTRKPRVAHQCAQFNSLSLNLPYAFFGIGRSNNYIENFHVIATTFTTTNNYNIFTPIIPNSQLLISENQVDDHILNWQLDLIVNPTSKLTLLVIVIAALLFILLLVIIILHSREIKEDQENENIIFTQWFN